MAKQTINIGSAPNDGTGDTARDAFDICNDNFTELYDGKVEPNTAFTGDLVFNEAADHASTPAAGKGYLWVKSTAPSTLVFTDDSGADTTLGSGGGIANVVEDTTPQLGGNLDVQANSITTSTVNGGITLTPNGTGDVTLGSFVFDADQTVGAGTDNYVFTYDNATGKVSLEAAAGGGGAFTADAQTQITPTTPIVLDEATGDEVALNLSYTVNKASSGNDTGLLINQTDTLSPGTSLLADFQVAGVSKFNVDSTGTIGIGGSAGSEPAIFYNANTNLRIKMLSAGATSRVTINNGSVDALSVGKDSTYTDGRVTLSIASAFGWSSNTDADSSPDLTLYRDAANTLALRNSTNAQTFNVYGTHTDSSNYERLAITGSAITVQTAGTGTDDIDLTLTPAGAGNVKFGTHSAISAETVTGYITIKDSSGTTRKLAVVS